MTGTFLAIALLLSLIALVFVLFPLLREAASRRSTPSQREANASVHRDRISELERDLEEGTLSREQFDAVVADLDRDLVHSGAVDGESQPNRQLPRTRRGIVVASATVSTVFVPVVAFAIYSAVGEPDQALGARSPAPAASERQGGQASGAAAGQAGRHNEQEVRALAQQLRSRLEENPEDRRGWVLYARTMATLEELEEAKEAFQRALELGADENPDVLAKYADVLAAQTGSVQGKPKELVKRALELNPEHIQALWLAGTAAYNQADYETARKHWEKILEVAPPQSRVVAAIRANLEEMPEAEE